MSPKAASADPTPPPGSVISGKWLIIGLLTMAIVAAGTSWWFRYFTTHRAAAFWGAQNARRIRDAWDVTLYDCRGLSESELRDVMMGLPLAASTPKNGPFYYDVSHARGLTHLRNALLDDRSYRWPPIDARPRNWGWALYFHEPPMGRKAVVLITEDFKYVDSPEHDRALSCEPISAGLAEMITEMSDVPTKPPMSAPNSTTTEPAR